MIYKHPKEDISMKRMRVNGGLVIITGDATEGSEIIVYHQKS